MTGQDREKIAVLGGGSWGTALAHLLATSGHHVALWVFEPDLAEPDITRGTLEGNIKAGDITFFRLQSTAGSDLDAYIAQGEVLDVDCESFGSIGTFFIPEMERFYRHVLIAKRFPHHGAVAFGHWGKALFEVFKYIGIADISYNRPKNLPYPDENPFA